MPFDGTANGNPCQPSAEWSVLAPAPWHRDRPEMLERAVWAAAEAAPHLRGMASRLLPRLPRRPLASQTIRSGARNRYSFPIDLDRALTCPWVNLDAEEARNVLAYDLDHDEGIELCEALRRRGAPVPHLMLDTWSGRSHAILPLATPVLYGPEARSAPQQLAERAHRLMAAALRATALPRRALVKSPWGLVGNLIGARLRRGPRPASQAVWDAYVAADSGLMWHTIPGTGPAELRAVVAALADPEEAGQARRAHVPGQWRRRRPEQGGIGRNDALFNAVRCWSYDRGERDGGAILAEAMRQNARLPNPLPLSEVACTARSIARFMATRYRPQAGPGKRRRGRDADTAPLPLTQRREIAGQRSAAARSAATDGRIRQALARLTAAGELPTQARLATEAGLSVRTIRGRWHRPGVLQDGAVSGGAEGSEAGGGYQAGQEDRRTLVTGRHRSPRLASLPAQDSRVAPLACPAAASRSPAADGHDADLASSRQQLRAAIPRLPGTLEELQQSVLDCRDRLGRHPDAAVAVVPMTLAGVSAEARAVRRVVAQLQAVAASARCRGAMPPALPEPCLVVGHLPAVVTARQAAEQAIADAERRAAGRGQRAAAAARRQELREAYTDPARGLPWWRSEMKVRAALWDGQIDAARVMGASVRDLEHLQLRRSRDLACCWRQWRAAARDVVMAGPPSGRQVAALAAW